MINELNRYEQAVIEKVTKLLALAKGNSNEHESAAATAKAMELLAAYNLDMAVIGSTGKGTQRKDTRLKGGLYAWQRQIWKATSELNFCMYWSIKGTSKGSTYEHRVLGSKANVASTQVMADYLQQAIERLAQQYGKDNGYRSVFERPLIAYREGMAARLVERLEQLRRDRLVEDERKKREDAARARHPGSAPSNALVLLDVIHSEQDYNTDYLNGWEPGTSARYRAEREARQAAAQAAADERLAARRKWEEENPEEAAAEAKAAKEANDKWWAEYLAKEEKKARRRGGRGPVYRDRAQTEQEKRAGLHTFGAGYSKGNEVGLDSQVDHDVKHKIGGR